jgi:hypothetical protein
MAFFNSIVLLSCLISHTALGAAINGNIPEIVTETSNQYLSSTPAFFTMFDSGFSATTKEYNTDSIVPGPGIINKIMMKPAEVIGCSDD